MLNTTQGVLLYTDGSSSTVDRSGGWAFLAMDAFDAELVESGPCSDTTNNRMEMTAVIEGLRALYDECGPCEVLIRSDSEIVVKGATDPSRGRKANKDLWRHLDNSVLLHMYVEFEHVKGHSGEWFNERVDRLAGDARKSQLTA